MGNELSLEELNLKKREIEDKNIAIIVQGAAHLYEMKNKLNKRIYDINAGKGSKADMECYEELKELFTGDGAFANIMINDRYRNNDEYMQQKKVSNKFNRDIEFMNKNQKKATKEVLRDLVSGIDNAMKLLDNLIEEQEAKIAEIDKLIAEKEKNSRENIEDIKFEDSSFVIESVESIEPEATEQRGEAQQTQQHTSGKKKNKISEMLSKITESIKRHVLTLLGKINFKELFKKIKNMTKKLPVLKVERIEAAPAQTRQVEQEQDPVASRADEIFRANGSEPRETISLREAAESVTRTAEGENGVITNSIENNTAIESPETPVRPVAEEREESQNIEEELQAETPQTAEASTEVTPKAKRQLKLGKIVQKIYYGGVAVINKIKAIVEKINAKKELLDKETEGSEPQEVISQEDIQSEDEKITNIKRRFIDAIKNGEQVEIKTLQEANLWLELMEKIENGKIKMQKKY